MPIIRGYANLYLSQAPSGLAPGEWVAYLPGAFTPALAGCTVANIDHRPETVFASTRDGSLRLRTDDLGLLAEISPWSNHDSAKQVLSHFARGGAWRMSFHAFHEPRDEVFVTIGGQRVRAVKRVRELRDVCLTTHPRFSETVAILMSDHHNTRGTRCLTI